MSLLIEEKYFLFLNSQQFVNIFHNVTPCKIFPAKDF